MELSFRVVSRPDGAPQRVADGKTALGFADLVAAAQSDWTALDRAGSSAVLEQCIQHSRRALAVASGQNIGQCSVVLGHALLERYGTRGQKADLNDAIGVANHALRSKAAGDVAYSERLHLPGLALRARHELALHEQDVSEAVDLSLQAFDAAVQEQEDTAKYLATIALCFKQQHQASNSLSDLDLAVDCGGEASKMAPKPHQYRAECLYALGSCLLSRFQRTRCSSDLNHCFTHCAEAITLVSEGHRSRYKYEQGMASAHMMRYFLWDQTVDVDDALRLAATACGRLGPSSLRRIPLLRIISQVHHARYTRGEGMADLADLAQLELTIDACEQALSLASAGRPERPVVLAEMSKYLGQRSWEPGRSTDLAKAVELAEEAVKTEPKSKRTAAICSRELGTRLYAALEKTSDERVLNRGIQCFQDAVDCFLTDIFESMVCLRSIGNGLVLRYLNEGRTSDLQQGIDYFKKAADCRPRNDLKNHNNATTSFDIGRALCFRELSAAYSLIHTSSLRSKESAVSSAVVSAREALAQVPKDHRVRPDFQINLANVLLNKVEAMVLTEDLIEEDALDGLNEAMRLCYDVLQNKTALDQGRKRRCHQALGILMTMRADILEDNDDKIRDFESAIADFTTARNLSTHGDPRYVECLVQLGTTYLTLSRYIEDTDNITDAIAAMKEAFELSLTRVKQLGAGIHLVLFAAMHQDWQLAALTIDKLIPMLPDVLTAGSSRRYLMTMSNRLAEISDMSGAIFLKAGRSPAQALRALENFRGFNSNLMLDAKADLSLLKQKQPGLWAEYTECQARISKLEADGQSGSAFELEGPNSYNALNRRRAKLFETLRDVCIKIRQFPGLEDFLRPLEEKDLIALASEGPLVCFDVNALSRGAFLVSQTGVAYLSLPGIKLRQMEISVDIIGSGCRSNRDGDLVVEEEAGDPLGPPLSPTEHLARLWRVAVRPVLKELRLLKKVSRTPRLPRIWWTGGAVMSNLPLHAAGKYTPETPLENTMSHVLSSYVSNLRTLHFLRSSSPASPGRTKPQFLMVHMSRSPGHFRNLEVAEETKAITAHWNQTAHIENLDRPGRTAVLKALRTCSIAHFSCHGTVDHIEPLERALILGRGTTVEKLTVDDVMDVVRPSGGHNMAYLAACHSAELTNREFVHESLHLASAFQLAGFQHVVGTLWKAHDATTSVITSHFYEVLARDDGTITGDSVPYALHSAVLRFRQGAGDGGDWAKWAPFVHFGS